MNHAFDARLPHPHQSRKYVQYATRISYLCFDANHALVKKQRWCGLDRKNKSTKSRLLYAEIDRNTLFKGTVEKADRSNMNVNFVLNKPELEADFDKLSKEANLSGLKGHRDVGGYRASLYNALSLRKCCSIGGRDESFRAEICLKNKLISIKPMFPMLLCV